jgi:hypothetical protein
MATGSEGTPGEGTPGEGTPGEQMRNLVLELQKLALERVMEDPGAVAAVSCTSCEKRTCNAAQQL